MGAARRALLGAFLRSRREALAPERMGLASGPRRRTPGLRREEVAHLSGVSTTWYTWLEQGRDIRVSRQVLEALCRALRLTASERQHLFTLADMTPPPDQARPAAVSLPVRRLLDLLEPNPALLIDDCWDILATNRAYTALFGGSDGPPPTPHNCIWQLFTQPHMRAMLVDWECETREVVGEFRMAMGQHPDNPRAMELVESLTACSSRFRALWSEHPVHAFRPATKRCNHPVVGRIDLNYTKLNVADTPSQHVVVFTPATDTDQALLTQLASAARSLPPLDRHAMSSTGDLDGEYKEHTSGR